MVSACTVIHRILNELKSWYPHSFEGKMVGPARIPVGDSRDAEILQRRHRLVEDMIYRCISLGVDAANPARPVVNIEICGNQFLLRFQGEWTNWFAQELRSRYFIGSSRTWEAAKMFAYVSHAAEQTFFFAGPQGNTNGAARFDLERVGNAHHLECNH